MEKRILVLDDDPGVLEALDLSLTFCGYQVRPLLSGTNILRMIRDFEPHLIILDYLLSDRDGGEICRQLKDNPETSGIPIIILSAHPAAADKFEHFRCDAFIAKPFDLNVLVKEIARFIVSPPISTR